MGIPFTRLSAALSRLPLNPPYRRQFAAERPLGVPKKQALAQSHVSYVDIHFVDPRQRPHFRVWPDLPIYSCDH
jgi:hypothetical protein